MDGVPVGTSHQLRYPVRLERSPIIPRPFARGDFTFLLIGFMPSDIFAVVYWRGDDV
jgi:hypothetical protein